MLCFHLWLLVGRFVSRITHRNGFSITSMEDGSQAGIDPIDSLCVLIKRQIQEFKYVFTES